MLVYRYMSNKEFNKVTAGVTLVNNNSFKGNKTNSKGFCFLPEKVSFYSYAQETEVTLTAQECYEFLEGIVSRDVLVEFETEEELEESSGVYADPLTDEWGANIVIDELCTITYDRDTFIPKRYCIPGDDIWYNVN